jgi:hypothetical protein
MLHHLWRMAWRQISEEDKIDVRLGEKSAVQATPAWQNNDILVGALQERILDPMTEIVDDLLPDLNVGLRGDPHDYPWIKHPEAVISPLTREYILSVESMILWSRDE